MKQVRALGHRVDILLAISTSENPDNVNCPIAATPERQTDAQSWQVPT